MLLVLPFYDHPKTMSKIKLIQKFTQRYKPSITFGLALLFILLLPSYITAMPKSNNSDFTNKALNEYHLQSNKLLEQESKTLPKHYQQLSSINKLEKTVHALAQQEKIILAALTVYANKYLLINDIESKETENIIWFLYKNNLPILANTLRSYALENASENTIARLNYQFAKYNYKYSYWEELIGTLQAIDINIELSEAEAHYSYFMMGVALQNIQQHRDALKVFNVIPESSEYFIPATLNKAISNLRQDWWTDAHIEINKLIARDEVQQDHELLDRLYLTMGYSQLHFEFYRDARDSFRSVGIEGRYTNQALLGIGLSAMHQKDFIAALNAFLLLNKNTDIDATTEESFILTPFVQEKLGQKQLAAAKYTEAVAYFQHAESEAVQNIAQFRANTINSFAIIPSSSKPTASPSISQQDLIFSTRLDMRTALRNIRGLIRYLNTRPNSNTLAQLRDQLNSEIKHLCIQKLEQQKEIYKSYLSQGRFALAKLYDKE